MPSIQRPKGDIYDSPPPHFVIKTTLWGKIRLRENNCPKLPLEFHGSAGTKTGVSQFPDNTLTTKL